MDNSQIQPENENSHENSIPYQSGSWSQAPNQPSMYYSQQGYTFSQEGMQQVPQVAMPAYGYYAYPPQQSYYPQQNNENFDEDDYNQSLIDQVWNKNI